MHLSQRNKEIVKCRLQLLQQWVSDSWTRSLRLWIYGISRLAESQGVSERALYRHLNGLTQHGLIELLQQERKSRNGRFSIARIKLTLKGIESLGLNETHGNFRQITPSLSVLSC